MSLKISEIFWKRVFQSKILKSDCTRWTHYSIRPFWAIASHTLAEMAKKFQKVPNEENFRKIFFSKFQKRSKKVEKMILSPMEVVSEWGNREKMWWKKKNNKFFWDFNSPNGHEGARNQTWPIKDDFSLLMRATCSQDMVKFGAFLKKLVLLDGF